MSSNVFVWVWGVGVVVVAGGVIGCSTGWLIKTLLRQGQRSVLAVLRDTIAGIMGLALGIVVSATSTSFVFEEWYDSKLVARRTDGFADHVFLFAISGAVALVVVVHFSIMLSRKLICNPSINTRARRARPDRFDYLLLKVPDVEPEDRDRF